MEELFLKLTESAPILGFAIILFAVGVLCVLLEAGIGVIFSFGFAMLLVFVHFASSLSLGGGIAIAGVAIAVALYCGLRKRFVVQKSPSSLESKTRKEDQEVGKQF